MFLVSFDQSYLCSSVIHTCNRVLYFRWSLFFWFFFDYSSFYNYTVEWQSSYVLDNCKELFESADTFTAHFCLFVSQFVQWQSVFSRVQKSHTRLLKCKKRQVCMLLFLFMEWFFAIYQFLYQMILYILCSLVWVLVLNSLSISLNSFLSGMFSLLNPISEE
jgi:hypothetical protein